MLSHLLHHYICLPSMIPFLASLVRTKLHLQTFSMLHENFLRLATRLALLQTSTRTPNLYLSTAAQICLVVCMRVNHRQGPCC
ncbi:hypothetical protein IPC95_16535 [Pseudomonas aeruginosa]|nr:hypothetical protein IPC95_16535 [Pseudomonas aeruginosa]